MFFSIIIPAYNCSETISNTISSIEKSGLSDFEIIAVNDGSTDDTGDVLQKLALENDHIQYFQKENGGVSSARNFGLQKASGEYVLFFDSDDTVDVGSFRTFAETIATFKPDLFIYGLSFDYYYKGRIYRREDIVPSISELSCKQEWSLKLEDLFRENVLSPVWNKIIRKSIIFDHKLQFRTDMILMEDFLFSMDLMRQSETIFFYSKPVYRYRQSESELGSYKRLCRIGNLVSYMKPFEEMSNSWNDQEGIDFSNINRDIYYMLFSQMMWFGTKQEIRQYSEHMLSSPYRSMVQERDAWLYKQLMHGKIDTVRRKYNLLQKKHRLAVFVKSISLRNIKNK